MILCLACAMPLSLSAQSTAAPLGAAISAANSGKWPNVSSLRAGLTDPVARDVVDWMRLRGQQGTFAECRDFIARNADWPGMRLLRLRCEYTIARGSDPQTVLEFFAQQNPQTGTGSLRLAEALINTDRAVEGARELKRAWLTFTMGASEHRAFVERNALTIKDLHEERLDMLLWRGAHSAADRMIPLVGDGWTRLAKARIALRKREGNVDTLIEAVPESHADDPGLAFERFLWRVRKDRDDSAIELLLERSKSAETLGVPQEWSNRRRALARQMMRADRAELAYEIASNHHLKAGSNFADLEWLSGYIALRKLNKPEVAARHFQRFETAVVTPISLGRAGYWLGRAYEAAGNYDTAASAFEFGAEFQSSFYGQLAAEKAGLPAPDIMAGTEEFPDWREAEFTKTSVFKAALKLHNAGHTYLAERFLVHLGESQTRTGLGQLGDFALSLNEPHIALMISKQAARQGHEIFKTYFPIATPAGMDLPIAPEFALSIARRESEFDPVVISPAGARGLMQLMPATAREVAGQIGETYSKSRLLDDPEYNARLGSAYLARLDKSFASNPVLMSAAYNAGPSRAVAWSRNYGDPRHDQTDVVDWIEHIPFRETRNYVMRVTESFAPYRSRLAGKPVEIALSQELKR